MGEHFCLKWNNHQENFTGIMTKLLDEQKFVDVSLVCEMKTFKAHQTVLSACSPYFEQVLGDNTHPHPIIILRDVKQVEMSALLQYMYRGEVNVRDDELSNFLQTAQALQIRGLSENKKDQTLLLQSRSPNSSPNAQSVTVSPPKRQRRSSSTVESTGSEKTHSEAQHSSAQSISKSSPNSNQKPPTNLHASTPPSYSDSVNEVHYMDLKTPPENIKQEDMSPAIEEMYHGISQHSQTSLELPRRESMSHHSPVSLSEVQHREWNVDYEPSSSTFSNQSYVQHSADTSRNYLSQKVELPKVPTPMTHSFSIQLQAPPPVPALFPCNSKKPPRKTESSSYAYDMTTTTAGMSLKPKETTSYTSGSPSVIQPVRSSENSETIVQVAMQRKGGRFRPGWMENYSWLQYDEKLNMMFCKTCRKWSGSVPDIRTSFVEGNCNFRLEIVNHHDKSKAHKLCVAKEKESIPRLEPINNGDGNQ